jgi:3-mercaptopyruvate sulfurtransferase SseA
MFHCQHTFSFFTAFFIGVPLLLNAGSTRVVESQALPSAQSSSDFPFAGAPRYEAVVLPGWVKALLDFHTPGNGAKRPPTYRNNRFVILETSWAKAAEAKEYRAGHLPGALHLNTDELENGYPRWRLRPVADLQRVLGALGITPATTVIVYSHQTIAAARVWWVLKYAGVADVRLLNGGFAAWSAAGYRGETLVNTPRPVAFSARAQAELLATTAYVRSQLRAGHTRLADARSREEYRGEISGYSYVDFKGRIPGAIHIGNADDAAYLYTNRDGTLRALAEVQALWEQAGIRNDERELIFYCGSGWRSSLAFLHAWLMGYRKIRNYSDGWAGWSTVYTPAAQVKGRTAGWRQERSANPVVIESAAQPQERNE